MGEGKAANFCGLSGKALRSDRMLLPGMMALDAIRETAQEVVGLITQTVAGFPVRRAG